MNERTRGRTLILLASALALVIATAVLLGSRFQARTDGPVPTTDPVGVEYEFAADEASTWGMTLPPSGAADAATLIAVEPQGVSGLEIIGIGVCEHAQSRCAVVNSGGWPPSGPTLLAPDGIQLQPEDQTGEIYQLLIGVRRQASVQMGEIASIKLVYSIGGERYEVVEPWTLRIHTPGTMSQ